MYLCGLDVVALAGGLAVCVGVCSSLSKQSRSRVPHKSKREVRDVGDLDVEHLVFEPVRQ